MFRYFPDQKYLVPMTVFGFATSLLFVADRTNLFLKENKQYDALTFGVLCLAALAAGCATMKPADKGDLGFLNRDQTDEWKGWMQIAILIYHYVGASKVSGIYNPIRVLVAAYLFMSGYGHLSFFVKKADFGFARVANILIRLNLLTVVLSYLMDTDYLSYYFSPLVTICASPSPSPTSLSLSRSPSLTHLAPPRLAGFGIIWVTLWAGHKFNGNSAFLLVKLVVAAALTACFFEVPGPLDKTFDVINTVFRTNWNAGEWRFRQTLDMWIVWVGMATAFAFLKIKEHRLADDPRWPTWSRLTVLVSALAMGGYFAFELTRESKFVYNASHPYVSAVPVLAFIVLRNATPWLRSTSSRFFIYFGQCSLETFIIQFHFFIAGECVLSLSPSSFSLLEHRADSGSFVVLQHARHHHDDPGRRLDAPAQLHHHVARRASLSLLPPPSLLVARASLTRPPAARRKTVRLRLEPGRDRDGRPHGHGLLRAQALAGGRRREPAPLVVARHGGARDGDPGRPALGERGERAPGCGRVRRAVDARRRRVRRQGAGERGRGARGARRAGARRRAAQGRQGARDRLEGPVRGHLCRAVGAQRRLCVPLSLCLSLGGGGGFSPSPLRRTPRARLTLCVDARRPSMSTPRAAGRASRAAFGAAPRGRRARPPSAERGPQEGGGSASSSSSFSQHLIPSRMQSPLS